MQFTTRTIRVAQNPDREAGAVIQPIFQSATFAWADLDSMPQHDYTRVSNPNRSSLEQVIASLENAEHCVCFGSGMAAILAAFSLLSAGDHLLVASDIYGGTQRVKDKLLPRSGVETGEFDGHSIDSLKAAIRPNTKMVIFETPTNPNLRVMDIRAIAQCCKENGILCVIDNTFASPYLQTPLDLGCDIVVHSTTKYISGHSDVIGGALVTNSDEIHTQVYEYAKTVGAVPSPFDCWLTLRGVKTLGIRMERHCSNAHKIAEYLESHPRVKQTYYPGLPSHPEHAIARRQMKAFGGMVSFEIEGDAVHARRFAEALKVFMLAESLGGVESIVGYPTLMSHGCMTEEERQAKGIRPTHLRLSVGIEDIEDLLEDLENAFEVAFADEPAKELAAV